MANVSIDIAGGEVPLALNGAVRLEQEAVWMRPEDRAELRYPCGYDCALVGDAIRDDECGRFVAFDLVAAGPRRGVHQYNNREDDLGPAPQGIAFGLAGTSPAERTAPHCLHTWRQDALPTSRVKVDRQAYFGAA